MFALEIKRAFINKFFYFALIIGFLSGVTGLFSYYSDIYYFKVTGNKEAITSYEAWLYCLSLGSGTIYRLIIPLLIAIPFADSYYRDFKSGYINYLLVRSKFKNYFIAKVTSCLLVGGFLNVLIMVLWLIITRILFPSTLPNTNLNYRPDGIFSFLYVNSPLLYILGLMLLGFIIGAGYSLLGLAATSIFSNKFAIISFPFIYFMTTLLISQIFNIDFLYPIISIAPYEASNPETILLVLNILILYLLSIFLLLSLVRKQRGEAL